MTAGTTRRAAAPLIAKLGGRVTRDLHIINAVVATLPAAKARELAAQPGVRAVSLNGAAKAQARGENLSTSFNQSIQAPYLWNTFGGTGRGVGVAVIDTGIAGDLPDFRISNTDKRSRVIGSAVVNPDATTAGDRYGHGTHVAGIIAALANNDVGITGVVDCRLSIWKVFDDEPDPEDGEYYVDMDRYLKALRAMEEAHVSALNLSLGGTESSQVEALLMKRLAKAGVCVFAAMGNEYEEGNPTEYPAAYATVWAVGAVNAASQRAEFSNTGKHIHIAAPGVGILSTLPHTRSKARNETNYASWDGTSMATPYVSGAAMLLCAQGVHKTPKSIARRLASTATRLKGMGPKSKSTSFGAGLLNLEKALR
jgi:subtilisin family serine protease